MSDRRHTRPLTQVEVEGRVAELVEELERLVEVHAEACVADANAEADWKLLFHSALLDVDGQHDRPRDAESRKAAAHRLTRTRSWVARTLDSEDVPERPEPYRVHLIAASRRDHAKEAIRACAQALSGQQTLLRSLSNLT